MSSVGQIIEDVAKLDKTEIEQLREYIEDLQTKDSDDEDDIIIEKLRKEIKALNNYCLEIIEITIEEELGKRGLQSYWNMYSGINKALNEIKDVIDNLHLYYRKERKGKK